MGAALSTVYYNMRLRHPTLDMPLIDYDLALLFQPMLMLGISIGVVCNVMFADWMVTVLLIILFIGNINVEIPLLDDYELVRSNLNSKKNFLRKMDCVQSTFLKVVISIVV
jgi:hypothetical protein